MQKYKVLLAICIIALLGAKPATQYSGRVVGITDGDTLKVHTATETIKVRLEGSTPLRRYSHSAP
jgi:endonuclease YncB( thermonuclease family)